MRWLEIGKHGRVRLHDAFFSNFRAVYGIHGESSALRTYLLLRKPRYRETGPSCPLRIANRLFGKIISLTREEVSNKKGWHKGRNNCTCFALITCFFKETYSFEITFDSWTNFPPVIELSVSVNVISWFAEFLIPKGFAASKIL